MRQTPPDLNLDQRRAERLSLKKSSGREPQPLRRSPRIFRLRPSLRPLVGPVLCTARITAEARRRIKAALHRCPRPPVDRTGLSRRAQPGGAHGRQSRRRFARPPSARISVKAEGGAAPPAKTRPWPVVLGVRSRVRFFDRRRWCIQTIDIARCAKRDARDPAGWLRRFAPRPEPPTINRDGLAPTPRPTPGGPSARPDISGKPTDKLPPTARRRLR